MKTKDVYIMIMKASLLCVLIGCITGIGLIKLTESYNQPIATKESITVQIISVGWTGSGFILENGIIVTAAHVMQDVVDAYVVFSDGTEIYLDPNTYYISQNFDLAFAKIAEYNGPTATLGLCDSIIVGAEIETCGFPLGEKYWHSFGSVARLPHEGIIDMDIDGVPGDSGGPVFLDGVVIGILTCGYDTTQMCSGIDISAIKAELCVYRILKD